MKNADGPGDVFFDFLESRFKFLHKFVVRCEVFNFNELSLNCFLPGICDIVELHLNSGNGHISGVAFRTENNNFLPVGILHREIPAMMVVTHKYNIKSRDLFRDQTRSIFVFRRVKGV